MAPSRKMHHGDGFSVSSIFYVWRHRNGQPEADIKFADINLPLAGIAFALVAVFLRVRTPEGTIREKLGRLDGT